MSITSTKTNQTTISVNKSREDSPISLAFFCESDMLFFLRFLLCVPSSRAKSIDPNAIILGSYETRALRGASEKILSRFYHRNPSNELREVENPCSEGSFGRWFLADFDWFFNFNKIEKIFSVDEKN